MTTLSIANSPLTAEWHDGPEPEGVNVRVPGPVHVIAKPADVPTATVAASNPNPEGSNEPLLREDW